METITNVANSAASVASRAIWGDANPNTTQASESGTEPLSGQTGDVSKGQPYDAGNAGNVEDVDTGKSSTLGVTDATQERWAADNAASAVGDTGASWNVPGADPIRPEHDQDKTGITALHEPASGFSVNRPTNSNQSSTFGPEHSVGADPTSAAYDEKQQGAERPSEAPKGDEVQAVKDSKADAEVAQNTGINASGTGENLVKTSGTKAEGGNFDAAQPGAGKEADRILETKGIQKEAPGKSLSRTAEDTVDDAGEKKHGFRAKVKGILHKS